jgi:hypothetical protein
MLSHFELSQMMDEPDEARNAIIEHIPPKTAAALLMLMDEVAAEVMARKHALQVCPP